METLQPKLRFPNFKNSYISINFNQIIEDLGYGPRFNSDDYDIDGNVKTIRGTDIGLNGEIKYDQVPLAKLDEEFIKNHILKNGDLVMITIADCGLTGVFKEQKTNYIPSAYAVKISLNKNGNPFYFKYFFQTSLATNQVNRFVRKATVANLPASDIKKIDLHIPSIEEQTKIANFLSAVDKKINQITEKKDLLEDYKKGIMQKIFNQEIRFKDDNGKDFSDWEEKMLKEIALYRRGSFPQPYGLSKWYDEVNGMPFVQVYDVDDNMKLKPNTKSKISVLGAKQSVFVNKGSLVITIQGSIGRIAKLQYDAYVDRTLLIFQSYKCISFFH